MAVRPLSKELQEIAISELNEVPSRIQADLNHIREWISKQPHLNARTDDQWLVGFLRGCKFSLQRTKEKLDFHYTVKGHMPEFFKNRDPLQPEIQEILAAGLFVVLPKTAHPSAPRINIIRTHRVNPETMSVNNLMKVLTMVTDILLLEDDNFVVAGINSIADVNNVPYGYVAQFTPAFSKKCLMCVQKVLPIRPKEINYVNSPSAFVAVFNMLSIFMSEKLRNRVQFHTESSFKNFAASKGFPISMMPIEYGGDEVSCDEIVAYWKKKVESYRDWFLEDEQYCTDEMKRPGKPRTSEEMFGVEGSFMKLEVD